MKRSAFALTFALAAMVGSLAIAQEADRGEGRRGGDRQQQQRMDPQQMRQRMMDRMREQLQASEDEWAVLQPRIERINEAQRATRGGGWGGAQRRGRGGDDQQQASQGPQTPVAQASQALRQAIDNNASADEIVQKLEAYRAARQQAEAELKAAQDDLRELVTPRQEAVLVMLGILE